MFCGKCGTKNADDATFCTGCGAKLNGMQVTKRDISVAVNTNDKNRKVGIIVVGVIAVIVIGLIIALFGGRSYKSTVNKFVNASMEADAKAIVSLIPDKVIDYIMDEEEYEDEDEMLDDLEEELRNQIDYIERYFGEDWKVSHEILSVEEVTGDDLDDLKDDYEDMAIKVSAAKTVEVQLTVKAGETESSNSMDVSVIKVGRSWYLDMESMGDIF